MRDNIPSELRPSYPIPVSSNNKAKQRCQSKSKQGINSSKPPPFWPNSAPTPVLSTRGVWRPRTVESQLEPPPSFSLVAPSAQPLPTKTPIRGLTEPSLWGLTSISQDGEPPCPAPPCPELPRQVIKDQWVSHEIVIDLFALFREARAGINKPMKEWLCNYCAMGESLLGYFVNYCAMGESRLGYFCDFWETFVNCSSDFANLNSRTNTHKYYY